MNNTINIAVVGLGQVGIYLLNELNTKKKDIELKTGKKINIVATILIFLPVLSSISFFLVFNSLSK